MKIKEKREYLLKKLLEKEKIVTQYDNVYKELQGPGLWLKIKRLFLQRNYVQYCLGRMGILKEGQTKLFWGKKITLPLADGSNFCLYFSGTLSKEEFKLTKFFIRNLKEDDIFYDIGANYGFYSLLANEIISKGEIHIFEPSSKIFSYLRKNLSQNKTKKIFLNNRAILDKNKIYPFFELIYSVGSTIFESVAKTYKIYYQETKIKAITLDSYTKQHNFPTFIKLDIEGGEKDALVGASEMLEKCSPIIAMEVWGGKKGEKFSRRAVNLLHKIGYHSYAIDEQGEIKPQERIHFKQIKEDFENLIFKR